MKKDYKNDSKKLTEALGGKENIKKYFTVWQDYAFT